MSKYYGIYTGIVIDNSQAGSDAGGQVDGRVLVKVDGITPAGISESYTAMPSDNTNNAIDIKSARDFAVRAFISFPILGESSKALYNKSKNKVGGFDSTTNMDKFGTDKELTPPAAGFVPFIKNLRDQFCDPTKNFVAKNNPYGHNFYPDHRYNSGRGTFAIPAVNSRVIIMFLNGNPSMPVIIGHVNSTSQFNNFYKVGNAAPGAPSLFENADSTPTSQPSPLTSTAQKGVNDGGLPATDSKIFSEEDLIDNNKRSTGNSTDTRYGTSQITAKEFMKNLPSEIRDHPLFMKGAWGQPYEGQPGDYSTMNLWLNEEEKDFVKKAKAYRRSLGIDDSVRVI